MIKRIAKTIFPERIVEALRVLKNGAADDAVGKVTYDQDGLRTIHNCDFIRDPAFERAYQAGERLGSWFGGKVHWRVHILFWAATRALQLEGDLVECGVHRGGFSKAIIEYVDFGRQLDKRFYLLDSFEGMSESQLSEEEISNGLLEYPYSADYESVKADFAEYSNVSVIKGRIPESLAEVPSEKVSFLSIDLNNAAPEIAAAEFFWNKLVSGAAVVLDDYGWEKHIVQKHAFDDFAARMGVPILSLPTGQGLIIKP
jgi:hypothetical protein